MNMLVLFVLVGVGVGLVSSSENVCEPWTCAATSCAQIETCDGRINPHGGHCGCCPECMSAIGEGGPCWVGVASTTECAAGLFCNSSSMCEKRVSQGLSCPPGICASTPCQVIDECFGRIHPLGDECGCCSACVGQSAEGERCFGYMASDAECAAGLFCNETSMCQKLKSLSSGNCPPNNCLAALCAPVGDCYDGHINQNGDECGCCPVCVRPIDQCELELARLKAEGLVDPDVKHLATCGSYRPGLSAGVVLIGVIFTYIVTSIHKLT